MSAPQNPVDLAVQEMSYRVDLFNKSVVLHRHAGHSARSHSLSLARSLSRSLTVPQDGVVVL